MSRQSYSWDVGVASAVTTTLLLTSWITFVHLWRYSISTQGIPPSPFRGLQLAVNEEQSLHFCRVAFW